ncbi:MAG: LPS export ABC transporter periplasmic protein LptC [Sphingomonas sp.]|nr:LPS export ABC transporter periplasmic protein LptC [Sphingomonas sp.]
MSEIAVRARTERQIWAGPGSSHDKVVATARFLLPVLIGILAAFLVTAPLTMQGDVSFLLDKNKVEVARERLRIQSAVYRGADANGRPFSLHAGSAVQKTSAVPTVQLDQLAAEIALADGPARLRADSGLYNLDTEQVQIDGPARILSSGGYDLTTSNPLVDLKSRQLSSKGGVTGKVPQGSFSADSMRARLEDRVVTLDGNARLRIVPRRTK